MVWGGWGGMGGARPGRVAKARGALAWQLARWRGTWRVGGALGAGRQRTPIPAERVPTVDLQSAKLCSEAGEQRAQGEAFARVLKLAIRFECGEALCERRPYGLLELQMVLGRARKFLSARDNIVL